MWAATCGNSEHPLITQAQTTGYGLCSKVKLEPATESDRNIIKQENVSPTPETDTTTEDLIKHAESLLVHARQLSAKQSRKRKLVNLDMETGTDICQDDNDQDQVTNPKQQENPIAHDVGTDSNATLTPPTQKIKCKLCKKKFYSIDELKNHHTLDHGVVKCNVCSKCFDTKSALEKHMARHNNSNWMCNACGKSFEYESRLI